MPTLGWVGYCADMTVGPAIDHMECAASYVPGRGIALAAGGAGWHKDLPVDSTWKSSSVEASGPGEPGRSAASAVSAAFAASVVLKTSVRKGPGFGTCHG